MGAAPERECMNQHIDPTTGRPYEVGPDGASRWLDEPQASAPARPWYRRVRIMAPVAAAAGFGLAAIGGNGDASSAAGPTPTTTVTSTVTATPTSQALSEVPPTTTTVTRTVAAKPRTVRVTVTRTATVQALAGDGTGGGGGGGGGSDVYYANCSEARAAGAAPLYVGDPGYRAGLDRDGDGIACE
jgi:hypothetical protein